MVSICIPTYNGEKYLHEALTSVIQQTYTNFEVVISDDASTDRTLEICENFAVKTGFSVKILQHIPQGIGKNWENCIANSEGEYIKFLFQDDLMHPDCLEEFVKIAANSNKKVFFCKRQLIGENGKIILSDIPKVSDLQSVIGLKFSGIYNFSRKNLKLLGSKFPTEPYHNFFGEPVVSFIHKSVFHDIGSFSDMKQLLDLEYWLRIIKKYDVIFLDKKLISFRIHPEQTSSKNNRENINDADLIRDFLLRKHFFYLNKKVKLELLYWKYSFLRKLRGKLPI